MRRSPEALVFFIWNFHFYHLLPVAASGLKQVKEAKKEAILPTVWIPPKSIAIHFMLTVIRGIIPITFGLTSKYPGGISGESRKLTQIRKHKIKDLNCPGFVTFRDLVSATLSGWVGGPNCDIIKNKYLIFVPVSWLSAPKTLGIPRDKSLLYDNAMTSGWGHGAGHQEDRGMIRGLELSFPNPDLWEGGQVGDHQRTRI